MRRRMRRIVMAALVLSGLGVAPGALAAGEADESATEAHIPLVTEEAVPETTLEVTVMTSKSRTEREYEVGLSAQYALVPRLSLELEAPLALRDPRDAEPTVAGIGDVELTAKYAVLLHPAHELAVSTGLTLTLPTGSERRELGGELALGPFVAVATRLGPSFYLHADAGYRWRLDSPRPAEAAGDEEASRPEKEQALTANLAGIYTVTRRVGLLLELNSVTLFRGEPELKDRVQLYVTPGLTVAPAPGWNVRAGVRVPLTSAKEFDYQILAVVTRAF